MKVTIAQLNPVVGDVSGNFARALETLEKHDHGTDLIVFPELFLTGYPPKDLLSRSWFVSACEDAVDDFVKASGKFPGVGVVLGAPVRTGRKNGKGLYNSAVLICGGSVIGVGHKSLLPTYDVFDEARYFDPAPEVRAIPFRGEKLGLMVCEDAWSGRGLSRQPYEFDPVKSLADDGASIFINISASPFCAGKEDARLRLVREHALAYGKPFVYVNQVGGNDELIFDGKSFCVDGRGNFRGLLQGFVEGVETIDFGVAGKPVSFAPQERVESVYRALCLGVKDYIGKCGFKRAVVGLSGGIDSAVTACIAADALGPENVLGVAMPSMYSSKESLEDAEKLAGSLGIKLEVVAIEGIYNAYLKELGSRLDCGEEVGLPSENIQARIRGNILMAFSNSFGYLVLSTGNKSELAVGYCTLYGDMSGGLGVLADVPKTMVYELTEYVNGENVVIPDGIVRKPPSAELKPNQCDQDTLPPYEVLDGILSAYVEEGLSLEEIVSRGFDDETVRWVIIAVNRNEYKRRQAPPGLRVTSMSWAGRRMPIAAKY